MSLVELHLVRLQLSTSAANNLDMSYVDIKMVFLEVKLDEEIWLALPVALRKDTAVRKIVVNINAPAGEILRLR